jgi:hypothetical protein
MNAHAALWLLLTCFVWSAAAGATAACIWIGWKLWDRRGPRR